VPVREDAHIRSLHDVLIPRGDIHLKDRIGLLLESLLQGQVHACPGKAVYVLFLFLAMGYFSSGEGFSQALQSPGTNPSSPQKTNPASRPSLPRHGDLIRIKGEPRIYLVQNGQRRAIASDEVFREMGFQRKNIRDLPSQTVLNLPEGPPLWSKETIAPFPDGALLRLKRQTQTYVIQGGRKCFIPDPETFHSHGYRWDQVCEVDQDVFDAILTGIPLASVKPPYEYVPPGQSPEYPRYPYPPYPHYPPRSYYDPWDPRYHRR
jgi:hypothetical protein